jgi:hypothetical protein
MVAVAYCLVFERQLEDLALSLARAKTGKRMAARIAIMAMTTRSSMSVKPLRRDVRAEMVTPPEVCRLYAAQICFDT